MRGMLLLRRTDERAVLMTYLFYRHRAAGAVWSVVGHVHRAVAPRLMERSARRGLTSTPR